MGHHLDGGLLQCWEQRVGCEKEAVLCGILEVWLLGCEVQGKGSAPLVPSGHLCERQRPSPQTKSPRYQFSEPSPRSSAVPVCSVSCLSPTEP